MGKTVIMRKGNKFADIFDSPETVAQAQRDGYHLCDEAETAAREALLKADEKSGKNNKGGNKKPDTKINLADLSKDDLLKFIGKRKLYDKSFTELEPVAIIPKILEKARDKIVEAGLKTANKAASLAEDELFALFDTIGK